MNALREDGVTNRTKERLAALRSRMNWKRGFHRLFFVLSAIWVIVAAFIRADQLHQLGTSTTISVEQIQEEIEIATAPLHTRLIHSFDSEHREATLSLAFLPPVVVYAFVASAFFALRWIGRGFGSKAAAQNKKAPPSLED